MICIDLMSLRSRSSVGMEADGARGERCRVPSGSAADWEDMRRD